MKKPTHRIALLIILLCAQLCAFAASNEYTLVIEAYDWGPNVSKVILALDNSIKTADLKDYTVSATRHSSCVEIPAAQASGSRTVVFAYVSDQQGKRISEGNYVTLVLAVAPNLPIASPIFYSQNAKCRGNNWIEYKLNIKDNKSNQVWDKEKNRIVPLMDQFDLSGKYKVDDSITLSYAFYKPKTTSAKSPLIILVKEAMTQASRLLAIRLSTTLPPKSRTSLAELMSWRLSAPEPGCTTKKG